MNKNNQRHILAAALSAAGLLVSTTALAQEAPGIAGKNDWIFYRNEFWEDQAQADVSIDLSARLIKVLEANGTKVVVALAPLKARIYAEHLPANPKLTPSNIANHDRMRDKFRAAGVTVADVNGAFLKSPARTGEQPLYFRHDTHWSSTGALLAAETIRDTVVATPALKAALDATPESKYTLIWGDQWWPMVGDLTLQMPKGSPAYEKEKIKVFEVKKEGGGGSLTGDAGAPAVTLVGSSYTADWTNFPVALRHALQRDVLSLSITADQGQWVGIETYLRNASFQNSRPKLIVWEMPERDVKSAPDMPYREARYVMNNTEWLMRAAAWAQKDCAASAVRGTASGATAKATGAADFVEINLDKPLSNNDYLSARVVANGSKSMTVEASGPGTPARKFTVVLAGDDGEHNFRLPILKAGGGYNKVKLYPGATSAFSFKNLQVCSQPAGVIN